MLTVVSAKTEVTLHKTLSFLYKNKFWNPEVEKNSKLCKRLHLFYANHALNTEFMLVFWLV